MTGRIGWEPNGYGGWTGHVGTIDGWLFQVWKRPVPEAPWKLEAALPDSRRIMGGTDPDELKATAERWLSEFISSLGASFGDALAADLRSRASEVRAMPADCTTERRDRQLFAAGLDRAADLAGHGDQPAANPEPPKEGQ